MVFMQIHISVCLSFLSATGRIINNVVLRTKQIKKKKVSITSVCCRFYTLVQVIFEFDFAYANFKHWFTVYSLNYPKLI